MAQPNPADVLESVKDLPTSGILAQDDYSGMLYLDLDNSWIYKSMEVLEDYGYIKPPWRLVFSPLPLGAHIRIVSEREAVDHELISESKGMKKIPWLGKTMEFKVIDAFPYHPHIRYYGIDSRYLIRVESDELDMTRMGLTGLPPTDIGFCINVGIRMDNWREVMNQKSESSGKTFECEADQRRKEAQTSSMRSGASSSKINSNLLLWLCVIIMIISVISSFGYNYFSNL